MASNPSLLADRLLTHAAGLRALAHGLLGDVHAGEDVLQETWLQALRKPPQGTYRVPGWLAAVTRSKALKRRRSERRRVRREEAAAIPESLASTEVEVEQREALRQVVDAVLALREPYQTIILQRYYQDLPPREIGRQAGVSLATVNSRLHRARDLLRRHLDGFSRGERRAWAPALAAATGWKVPPLSTAAAAATSIHSGGVPMLFKIAAGAVVAAGSVLYLQFQETDPQNPSARQASFAGAVLAQEGANVAQPMTRKLLTDPVLVAKETPASQPSVAKLASSGFAYEYQLEGVIVDEEDLPVGSAHLMIGPPRQPLNDAGEVKEDGSFQLRWRAPAAKMPILLSVRKAGLRSPGLWRMEVRAAAQNRVRLAVHRRQDSSQTHISFSEVAGSVTEVPVRDPPSIIEMGTVLPIVQPGRPLQYDADGWALFSWPPPRQERDWFGFGAEFATPIIARAEESIVTVKDAVLLKGVVRNAQGEPVASSILRQHGTPRAEWTRSKADGSFLLRLPIGSSVRVIAAATGQGLAERRFDLSTAKEGHEIHWSPQLDPGLQIHGKLLQQRDEFPWVMVQARHRGSENWYQSGRIGNDLGFALANLPGSPLQVWWSSAEFYPLAERLRNSVAPGSGPLELEVPAKMGVGEFSILCVDSKGNPVKDAAVQVWQGETQRGTSLDLPSGQPYRSHVPTGRFGFRVGSPTHGYRDLGDFWMDAGQLHDLGTIALPTPARLHWSLTPHPELAPEGTWNLFRTDTVTWTLVSRGAFVESLDTPLPAGEYRVVLEAAGLRVAPIALTLTEGEDRQLQFSLEDVHPVVFHGNAPDEQEPAEWQLYPEGSDEPLISTEIHASTEFPLLLKAGDYQLLSVQSDGSFAETSVQVRGPARVPVSAEVSQPSHQDSEP